MNIIIKSLIIVGSVFTGWIILSLLLAGQASNIIYHNQASRSKITNSSLTPVYINNSNGNKIQIVSNQDLNTFQYQGNENFEYFLHLHGNAGRLDNIIDSLISNPSIVIVSPAYPGYHESEGSPSVDNIYQTALDTYNYMVKTKGIPENKITIFGHSLGGSPATYLASQKPNAKKLVLVNTFSSVQSMCWSQYSIFCVFTGEVFNTAKNAELVTIPVVQFHYNDDEIVPYTEGKTLYTYFKKSKDKKFVELTQFTHAVPNFDIIFEQLQLSK